MIATGNNRQRAAQRRSRGHSVGAAVNAAPAIIDHENQSRSILSARISPSCAISHSALHCRLRPAFFSNCRGDLHSARRVRVPSLREPATFIRRCAWRAANTQFSRRLTESRAHQLRISDKPGSDLAYPLHRSTPSVVRGFQHPEHMRGDRESCSRNQRKSYSP